MQADPDELAKRVDADRLKRDEGRLLITKESYDLMIDNTGMTEEEFFNTSAILIEHSLLHH